MDELREHFVVVGIIALVAVVFVIQATTDDQLSGYCTVPKQVVQAWGATWENGLSGESIRAFATLLTATLLHADFQHILMNMVFLWVFGSLASRHLGVWWPIPIFLLTGVAGSVLHVVLNRDESIPMLGASGAVSGFEGVYLALAIQWRLDWPDVWPIAHPIPPKQLAALALVRFGFDIYGLASQGHGVAFGAHIGGLLSGMLLVGILTTIWPSEEAFRRSVLSGRRRRR